MKPHEFPSATNIAEAVQSGQQTAAEIAGAALGRVEAYDHMVRAFACVDPALVEAQAQAVDGMATKGKLAGVTVGVKDVIATKDLPTSQNNSRYQGRRTGVDAACIDTLRHHGAVLLGKTVTTEFAATQRGSVTCNPHDFTRTPGGSSSGSAAAVAAGLCALALGTQTGGSVIRPAAFCGVWGWKPTWNTISREGLKLYSLTCDTVGFYANDPADFTLLADVFDLDPAPQRLPTSLRGQRIGLCKGPNWHRVAPAMRTAFEDAAKRLRLEGADVVNIHLPDLFNDLDAAHGTILAREGRTAFHNELSVQGGDLHPEFHEMTDRAKRFAPMDVRMAYTLADTCRSEFEELISGFDAIITPSATDEAPVGLANTGDPSMNSIWTLLHVPVVSVPGLLGPHDLPLGISVITPRYTDRMTIALATLVGDVLSLEAVMS
ncbi:MAG: hypothetical protein BM562_04530 [Alphaproteobacteria bacterium MedPE-SWcel]|nr:MAG: hypothetical protein BM562_04530 [Alphaproteobacteria bacterium MedPE-SWcel]